MLSAQIQYLTNECILLNLTDFRILLDTPQILDWDQFDALQEVHWDLIDYILISSYKRASSLVYILEYTGFRGQVFATQPSIEFLKFASRISHILD